MRARKWFGLLAAAVIPLMKIQAQSSAETPNATGTVPAPEVSPGAAEVIKMAESGTSEDILLAYVQNSTATFDLSADQILYLRDIGLSSPLISAMLNRDTVLKTQSQSYGETPDQPAPASVPVEAPAPEPTLP